MRSHVRAIFSIAALVCLTSLELGAQTSFDALPNAPRRARPLFLAYGQNNAPLSTTPSPPQPGGGPLDSHPSAGREDCTCQQSTYPYQRPDCEGEKSSGEIETSI